MLQETGGLGKAVKCDFYNQRNSFCGLMICNICAPGLCWVHAASPWELRPTGSGNGPQLPPPCWMMRKTNRVELQYLISCSEGTCSTTVSVSRTIMETSVAKLPSICDSNSGSQSDKMSHMIESWDILECRADDINSKVDKESIRSEALLGSMQSGGSLPELWAPFQRLPEPSMLGDGGPPKWWELDKWYDLYSGYAE